jgi:hypothetical protein
VIPTGATVSTTWIAGRLLTARAMQIQGAASVTDVKVAHRIESYLAAPLAGQVVTVQAQINNNTGGTITPTLTVLHPTAADNYASTVIDINAVALQSCPAGGWTQIAYTFVATASASLGLQITFDFGNNFSTTAKYVSITECDIRVTPGETLGINNVPPIPELRPITTEYHLCCRYYQYNNGAIYGTTCPSGGAAYSYWSFKAQMRATPSIGGTAPSTTYQNTCPDGVGCYNSAGGNYSIIPSGATASAELWP